jgi:hypothetical protein
MMPVLKDVIRQTIEMGKAVAVAVKSGNTASYSGNRGANFL